VDILALIFSASGAKVATTALAQYAGYLVLSALVVVVVVGERLT
jgi:hypothetical protein